jgi:hypothetical protein
VLGLVGERTFCLRLDVWGCACQEISFLEYILVERGYEESVHTWVEFLWGLEDEYIYPNEGLFLC